MIIAYSRVIGPVRIDCIIREAPSHRLAISEIPIESGAKITDHAYIEAKRLVLEIGDGAGAATFASLVRFQETRIPFTIVTGLYVYRNMLIAGLEAGRDWEWSRTLRSVIELQEAIIVSSGTAAPAVGESPSTALPGGLDALRAVTPSAALSAGFSVVDRAAGLIQRGDAAVRGVIAEQATSILRGAFRL